MKKKILVVEDEEGLRLLYEEELKSEGYEGSHRREWKRSY